MSTILSYLEHPAVLEKNAVILSVDPLDDGSSALILDDTILYAQGGGQPSDAGTISTATGTFEVKKVLFANGIVTHYGQITDGTVSPDQAATVHVDQAKRFLNTRLHSAGHLVDSAMKQAGQSQLLPTKGYHFPDGPSVEYSGSLSRSVEDLMLMLNENLRAMISRDFETQVRLVTKEELVQLCDFVPEYLPVGKPIRAVTVWESDWIPCGGTHVNRLSDLGSVTVKKIKQKGDTVKVSYTVA